MSAAVETMTREADSLKRAAARLTRVRRQVGRVDRDLRADTRGIEAAFGEGDGQTAVRTVVRRSNEPRVREVDEQRLQGALGVEIERRRHAAHETMHHLEVLGAAKLAAILAEQHDDIA